MCLSPGIVGLSFLPCSGIAPNYWVLLVARMMSGAGEAAVFVLMPPYFLRILPESRVGKMIAIFYLGLPLGFAGK
jgi:predicted MFS family arabinose efflux permease